jgi:hypothetical protein
MRLGLHKYTISVIVSISLVGFSFAIIAYADNLNSAVFSKDSSPYGIPYGQWLNKWWTWNQGLAKSEHPRENYSPQRCTLHQSGPVWFLADILSGKEERTCTIPVGKAILVPLLTGEYHNDASVKSPLNKEQMRAEAMKGDENGVISATLDGVKIRNLEQYRTQSFSNITIGQNNIFDNLPGTYPSYVDGFFVFLQRLPPGKHDLDLKTQVLKSSWYPSCSIQLFSRSDISFDSKTIVISAI